jgi:hypothetical protein
MIKNQEFRIHGREITGTPFAASRHQGDRVDTCTSFLNSKFPFQ